MAEERVERRLAAILAADVAGYSRLMGEDEAGTLARLKAHRRELIDPCIAAHKGRIVKTTGDGILIEFPSVVEAVACAVEVQRAMAECSAAIPPDHRIEFRVGINLGDVIAEADGDLYGDGINVAARLQGLAAPGGICVSRKVFEEVRDRLALEHEYLGEQHVKNIARPVKVYRVSASAAYTPATAATPRRAEQEVRFCTAADGVRIAYATIGEGPALVKAANWLNHLEFDWQSPIWRHWIEAFARGRQFVRYDERGNGLSDWDVADLSFEMFVRDLEAVVDALGLERFALLGVSQGAAVSIVYAARHPGRVSRLVISGGYVLGWRKRAATAEQIARREALLTLVRQGWGQDNPAFRQVFTSLLVPGATLEEMQWFNDLQRVSTSPENAVRLQHVFGDIDVTELLPRVAVPTLVLHSRDDAMIPFEQGRMLARAIPNARFVALDSRNHLVLEHEPAWRRFVDEVRGFLDEGG